MSKYGWTYIMSNSRRTVFYTGVTSDIENRILQHKLGMYGGFTKRYNCHDLIYYEEFDDILIAIQREKQIKRWRRSWKLDQIKSINPELEDLSYKFL